MKVWALAIINLLFCISVCCAEDAAQQENDQGYYDQDASCCSHCYYRMRRYDPELNQMYQNMTETYWPGKREDSIIDEVKRPTY